jgi:large subunit ribosomal protein L6
MSRIGKQPITIKDGVEVKVSGGKVSVIGPLGELNYDVPKQLKAEVKDNEVVITRDGEDKFDKSVHGTFRAIVSNAIDGVKEGYEKTLELVGVGYRVQKQGEDISLSLGLNHPIVFNKVEDIEYDVPDETTIVVKGFDKQKVGEVAAKIREIRKPEPYKGKGVRYKGEYVRRKTPKVVTVE